MHEIRERLEISSYVCMYVCEELAPASFTTAYMHTHAHTYMRELSHTHTHTHTHTKKPHTKIQT